VDGELKLWAGATRKTLSPIWIQQPDGSLQQVELGSYPIMGEKESDEALEAAVRAYNNGRGEWPMMKVGERIACMQNFIQRMVEQRDLIVKLIMWEIGKSLAAWIMWGYQPVCLHGSEPPDLSGTTGGSNTDIWTAFVCHRTS
jgi:glyceraldehyde-3-phosphate dehydrogenase (NADP+)